MRGYGSGTSNWTLAICSIKLRPTGRGRHVRIVEIVGTVRVSIGQVHDDREAPVALLQAKIGSDPVGKNARAGQLATVACTFATSSGS